MIGYEGESVKLSCPGAGTPSKPNQYQYLWYIDKLIDDGTKQIVVSYQVLGGIGNGPFYNPPLDDTRASLDKDDGSLPIHQLQLTPTSDETRYKCDIIHKTGYINLNINGMIKKTAKNKQANRSSSRLIRRSI